MKEQFYILLSFKVHESIEPFARFELNCTRAHAAELFDMLAGDTEILDGPGLCVELMETVQGLPLNLRMKLCTLRQLQQNCNIITKEIFKLRHLEGNL